MGAQRTGSRTLLPFILVAGLTGFAAIAADNPGNISSTVSPSATNPSATSPADEAPRAQPGVQDSLRKADFGAESVSDPARELADRVVQSRDNQNLPFIVIDKVQARVYVFNADGRLRGASTALLGLAIGDQTVPGIGQKKLSAIRPDERTTPAGRFMASLDKDIHGIEVLWVDYDSAVSLHRVVQGTPKERRAQRMASSNVADKRITYGCINVSVPFYDQIVSPSFKGTYGVVYVMPETRPAREVFGFYATSGPVPAQSVQAAAGSPLQKPAN